MAVAVPLAWADAESEFKAAWKDFHALRKDDRRAQYRSNWQALETRFLGAYKESPRGAWAPKSLFYVGRVNYELGKRSFLKTDYRVALDYFQRVASRFPSHTWSDDALFHMAVIERDHLQAPARALRVLQAQLASYPQGDMADRAKALMAEIEREEHVVLHAEDQDPRPLPEVAHAPTVSDYPEGPAQVVTNLAPTAAARGEAAEGPAVAPAMRAKPAPPGPARLKRVTFQSSDDYTRVVVALNKESAYTYNVLEANPQADKPPRLYIDFKDSRLDGAATDIPIADGILRRVRAGQNKPDVTRVVLDFQTIHKYKIFAMESGDEYRVLIDVSAPDQRAAPQTLAGVSSVVRQPIRHAPPEKRPVAPPKAKPAEAHSQAPPAPPSASLALAPDPKPAPPATPPMTPSKKGSAAETVVTRPEPAAPAQPAVAAAPPTPEDYTLEPESKAQAENLLEALGLKIGVIMIDPGHGGKDPGGMANGLVEKDVNLRFAKILGRKLTEAGFTVLYTREKDVFIPLEERTAMANLKKADLFISIHCNAFPTARISGLETYYLDLAKSDESVRVAARENAVSTKKISDLQFILTDLMLSAKTKESRELAASVHETMVQNLRRHYTIKDLGVRSAPFYVLMGAHMPSILVELGYMTHPDEAKRLKSETYLERQAAGLVEGVKAYQKSISRYASL